MFCLSLPYISIDLKKCNFEYIHIYIYIYIYIYLYIYTEHILKYINF